MITFQPDKTVINHNEPDTPHTKTRMGILQYISIITRSLPL